MPEYKSKVHQSVLAHDYHPCVSKDPVREFPDEPQDPEILPDLPAETVPDLPLEIPDDPRPEILPDKTEPEISPPADF